MVQKSFGNRQVRVDFAKVMERMRKLRADIAPVDSHETSKQVGVDVYMGTATFKGKHELQVGVSKIRDPNIDPWWGSCCEDTRKKDPPIYRSSQVGDQTLRFRKAVIATGGRAKVPPIPGLDQVPCLTNASLFLGWAIRDY